MINFEILTPAFFDGIIIALIFLIFKKIISLKAFHTIWKGLIIALIVGVVVAVFIKLWPWKAQMFKVWQGIPMLSPHKENVSPEIFSKVTHSDNFLWQAIVVFILGILLVLGIAMLIRKISRRKS